MVETKYTSTQDSQSQALLNTHKVEYRCTKGYYVTEDRSYIGFTVNMLSPIALLL